jgi:hypothetical protein
LRCSENPHSLCRACITHPALSFPTGFLCGTAYSYTDCVFLRTGLIRGEGEQTPVENSLGICRIGLRLGRNLRTLRICRDSIHEVQRVRRVAVQFVAALGLMIASAIFNLGPCANAAYLTTADSMRSASSAASANTRDQSRDLQESHKRRPIMIEDLQSSGGCSSPSSGSASGSSPANGLLSPLDLPTSCLVVYYREASIRLDFSWFIDSLLDPPRDA